MLLDGNETKARDRKLPKQHNRHSPAGHLSIVHEVAHRRQHKHLVRQRVHELAEIRNLVVMPRDIAVKQIRQACNNVDNKRRDRKAAVGKNQPDRDQYDPQYCYFVRRGL